MEMVVSQQIYYSNKELVPIKEIAESLQALDAVIRHSPEVLEALFPGTKIESVEVFIKELRSDSIWEDLVVKFVFGSQKKFDQLISNIRERVGMDNLMNNPQLLSVIILVLILSGGAYYLGKDQSADPAQRATIEANNNNIINIGAGMMEMSAEEFKLLIDGAIKDKAKLAKDAVRMVKPAKRDPEASITFNDNTELQITSESVRAMPRYVSEPEEEEFIEDYSAIEMELRATDLDSTKRGWAVVVPELGNRRVRLQLDPTVSPEELYERRKFSGNATIIFGFDKDSKRIPKLVFLREVIK
ncbi:MAG: hypothetical protein R3E46_05820 [Sedimenticolaceae bacterium]